MKRMVSGIKPTGQLHLGSYLGALKHFVEYQNEYDMYIFVANLHCITVYQKPEELKKNLIDCIALYIACGLDPKRTTIFLQSDVKEHAQLGWIMNCNTYLGELNRMTQFKDKQAKGEQGLTGGIYTYPSLMSADILLYDADYVPVGDDQKQHVELCRDVAMRFNNRYGDTFIVPEPLIAKVGARIMSLNDPTKKMSKSDNNEKGCIYLLDDLKKVRKKIMSAKTDDVAKVQYDPINQPGIANLMQIASAFTNESFDELTAKFDGKGYGDFKKYVADIVCAELEVIQSRYHDIVDSGMINTILENGAIIATAIAKAKLDEVQRKIGIEVK